MDSFCEKFYRRHTGEAIEAKLEDLVGQFLFPEDIPKYAVNDQGASVKLAIAMSSLFTFSSFAINFSFY